MYFPFYFFHRKISHLSYFRQVEATPQMTVVLPVVPVVASTKPEEATMVQEGTQSTQKIDSARFVFLPSAVGCDNCSACSAVPCARNVCVPSSVSRHRDAVVDHDTWIRLVKAVRGSFSQADRGHGFVYPGVQCMAIALASLAKHTLRSVGVYMTWMLL